MSGHGRRLSSLEAASAPGSQARRWSEYTDAINRTNVTGLASLADYLLAFGPLARENREWICAQLPLFAAMKRAGVSVSGVPMVVMHPPGQDLPEELREGLKHIEDVVTATGTQVLEMRESSAPYAADFSVGRRQELAILYIALGDAQGKPIRELAWERTGSLWQHSPYVRNLAATRGLSRREYEDFREPLSWHLPPADDPEVQAKVRPSKSAPSAGLKESRRPWISFADTTSLVIEKQETNTGQSDQVRSGHEDR